MLLRIIILCCCYLCNAAYAASATDGKLDEVSDNIVNKLEEVRQAILTEADESPIPSAVVIPEVVLGLEDAIPKTEARKLTKAIDTVDQALYEEDLSIRSAGPITKQILEGHATFGCPKGDSPGLDEVRNLLSVGGARCEVNPDNGWVGSYADMLITRLLSQNTLSDVSKDALIEVIAYLTDPFPSGKAKDLLREDITSEQGQRKFIEQLVNQSLLSVSRNSFLESYYSRLAVVDNHPADNPDSATDNVVRDQEKFPTATFDKPFMQIMEDESKRRIMDTNWINALPSMSTDALLREMLYLDAYRLRVEHFKYKQQERVELLLATIVSLLVAVKSSDLVSSQDFSQLAAN